LIPDVFDRSLAQTLALAFAQIIAQMLVPLFERGSDNGAG